MNSLEISCDMLHYKRVREDPMYRLQLQISDMRAELEPAHSQYIPEEPIISNKEDEPWSNKQWDTINQLKAQVLFLSSKVNEMRAKASKRKPKYTIK